MSSVLFLAHRSRARVNARSPREERMDERERERGEKTRLTGGPWGWGKSRLPRENGVREEEGRGAKRSEGSKSQKRFARKRAHAQWNGRNGRMVVDGMYAAAPRREAGIGEDRTRWATRERGIGREEAREGGRERMDGWMDGWTRGKRATNLLALFRRRGSRLVSIRRPIVIRILTLVLHVELFEINSGI